MGLAVELDILNFCKSGRSSESDRSMVFWVRGDPAIARSECYDRPNHSEDRHPGRQLIISAQTSDLHYFDDGRTLLP